MAFLCKKLNICSGARNTCLPLHIIVGILFFNIITLNELIRQHGTFVRDMLSSKHMREDGPTINAFLKRLGYSKKYASEQSSVQETVISYY